KPIQIDLSLSSEPAVPAESSRTSPNNSHELRVLFRDLKIPTVSQVNGSRHRIEHMVDTHCPPSEHWILRIRSADLTGPILPQRHFAAFSCSSDGHAVPVVPKPFRLLIRD